MNIRVFVVRDEPGCHVAALEVPGPGSAKCRVVHGQRQAGSPARRMWPGDASKQPWSKSAEHDFGYSIDKANVHIALALADVVQ
jgi:hypothetical protein